MSEIIGPVAAEMLKQYGLGGGCFCLLFLLLLSERAKRAQAREYADNLAKLYEKLDAVQEKRVAELGEGIRTIERAGSSFALALNFIGNRKDRNGPA